MTAPAATILPETTINAAMQTAETIHRFFMADSQAYILLNNELTDVVCTFVRYDNHFHVMSPNDISPDEAKRLFDKTTELLRRPVIATQVLGVEATAEGWTLGLFDKRKNDPRFIVLRSND